jgi:hypothetical protein
MISNWTLVFRYVALGSLAFSTGPLLVPFFVHTDPIIALHAQTPDVVPVSGWYGPGAWVSFVLTSLSVVWRVLSMSWHIARDHSYITLKCETCTLQYEDQWDSDLLVSLVYTSFAASDLMRHSLRILHADKPSLDPSILPAMQASAISVYIGCGLAHVIWGQLLFAGLCECCRGNSVLQFARSRWRWFLVSGVMLGVTYVGVITCEHSQAAIFAQDELAPTLTFWPNGTLSTTFKLYLGIDPPLLLLHFRFWSFDYIVGPLGYLLCLYVVSRYENIRYSDTASEDLGACWARYVTYAIVAWFIPLGLAVVVLLTVIQVFRKPFNLNLTCRSYNPSACNHHHGHWITLAGHLAMFGPRFRILSLFGDSIDRNGSTRSTGHDARNICAKADRLDSPTKTSAEGRGTCYSSSSRGGTPLVAT